MIYTSLEHEGGMQKGGMGILSGESFNEQRALNRFFEEGTHKQEQERILLFIRIFRLSDL